ncbi:3-isopropylmalate dehydratase small subunit [Paraburkholderia jirisanensis]
MQRFERVEGAAVPLLQENIDTDQVLPSSYMRGLNPDYAAGFFGTLRKDPDFVLNQPAYRGARMLVAGDNFGCGSTREHAVWAIEAFGLRVVVSTSLPEVFRENCVKNSILPLVLNAADHSRLAAAVVAAAGRASFSVDLVAQRIDGPDGFVLEFDVPAVQRTALLEGLDEIGLTLREVQAIEAYEAKDRESHPWQQAFRHPT